MTRAFILAFFLVSAATSVRAQVSEPEIAGDTASIENRGTGVPTSTSGDVAGAGTNRQSDRGDRRTLDDLKAGTSGTTQTR